MRVTPPGGCRVDLQEALPGGLVGVEGGQEVGGGQAAGRRGGGCLAVEEAPLPSTLSGVVSVPDATVAVAVGAGGIFFFPLRWVLVLELLLRRRVCRGRPGVARGAAAVHVEAGAARRVGKVRGGWVCGGAEGGAVSRDGRGRGRRSDGSVADAGRDGGVLARQRVSVNVPPDELAAVPLRRNGEDATGSRRGRQDEAGVLEVPLVIDFGCVRLGKGGLVQDGGVLGGGGGANACCVRETDVWPLRRGGRRVGGLVQLAALDT